MKVCNVSGIGEFHARLFSATESTPETGALFGALRKLTQLEDPRQLSENDTTLSGWSPWVEGEDDSLTPAHAGLPA